MTHATLQRISALSPAARMRYETKNERIESAKVRLPLTRVSVIRLDIPKIVIERNLGGSK